jgi:DNA modification methylase
VSHVTIINADVLAALASMPDESHHMVMTSPPYWGLRDYSIEPSVWGGHPDCRHRWGRVGKRHRGGPQGQKGERADRDNTAKNATGDVKTGQFCSYCGGWRGCLGMEPTIALYVEHMVMIFREVRRVLRRDGTCWLNVGDTYAGSGRGGNPTRASSTLLGGHASQEASIVKRLRKDDMVKLKDMALIPERLIVALQDDGWYVRRDIIWHKEAAMPESCRDRPTTAHEYLWLLSKRPKYFYDQWAIAEPTSPDTHARMGRAHNSYQAPGQDEQGGVAGFRENTNNGLTPKIPAGWDTGPGDHKGKRGRYTPKQNESFQAATSPHVLAMRNARSVWTINPEPFGLEMCGECHRIYDSPEFRKLDRVQLERGWSRVCRCGAQHWVSHFATFPTALVERCIRAGTSEKGVCPSCFAPWVRVVKKGMTLEAWQRSCGADASGGYSGQAVKEYAGTGAENPSEVKARILAGMRERVTVGWRQSCACVAHEPVKNASVLDIFGGSGTVGVVADRMDRNATLIEVNPNYVAMARYRVRKETPLLAHVDVVEMEG